MDTDARTREILAFVTEQHYGLLETPVRLADIRARMAAIEEFAGGDLLQRSVVGEISRLVQHYYPLSEWIALYHREMDIYHQHIRDGDFDDGNYRNVRVSSVFGLCESWMRRYSRYPYGDARRLRPFITELFAETAGWDSVPYPDYIQELEQWHRDLAPGGDLCPSAEHLAYVDRFEAFAEDILWDSRGQDYITIRNFPAPPKTWPNERWWSTRHLPRS